MSKRWNWLVPLTGVLFAGLFVALMLVAPSSPSSSASGAAVISFYRSHQSALTASNFLGAFAALDFLFFAAILRTYLRTAGQEGLAALGFGAGVVVVVGFASFSGFSQALSDVPDKLDPSAAQALNVLSNDFFFPFLIGSASFMVAAGAAVIRSRALPRWLGWVTLVIGILAMTPLGFFVFFALPAWVLLASVLMYLKSRGPRLSPAAGQSSATPAPA